MQVAIIGGGASGIFCAVLLSLYKIPVLLFEKNKTLGKKLLASGNGKCNIHNIHISYKNFQTQSFATGDLQKLLGRLSFSAFEKICQKLGLLLEIQDNGRVYPLSHSSKSVLGIFQNVLHTAQHSQIHLENTITSIQKTQEGFLLQNASREYYFSTHLILACGSQAAPKLGGSDLGFQLARQLHLKLENTYPVLCPILIDSQFFKHLSGTKIKAKLTLKANNQKILEHCDDVLFTDYGISGFCALDISLFLNPSKTQEVFLDFLPTLDLKTLENLLLQAIKSPNTNALESQLSGFLHPKIAKAILQHHPLHHTKHCKQLAFLLKNFLCQNAKAKGFESAEASAGGVSGKAINPLSLESLSVKNLYIIGEMLDVVGDRGGYNLAFAWTCAWCCAQNIQKHSRKT